MSRDARADGCGDELGNESNSEEAAGERVGMRRGMVWPSVGVMISNKGRRWAALA